MNCFCNTITPQCVIIWVNCFGVVIQYYICSMLTQQCEKGGVKQYQVLGRSLGRWTKHFTIYSTPGHIRISRNTVEQLWLGVYWLLTHTKYFRKRSRVLRLIIIQNFYDKGKCRDFKKLCFGNSLFEIYYEKIETPNDVT